jgi:hypothetical protein
MRLSIKDIEALKQAIVTTLSYSAVIGAGEHQDAEELRELWLKLQAEKSDIEFEENKIV